MISCYYWKKLQYETYYVTLWLFSLAFMFIAKAKHPMESRTKLHTITRMGCQVGLSHFPVYTVSVFSNENCNKPIFSTRALQPPCSLFV